MAKKLVIVLLAVITFNIACAQSGNIPVLSGSYDGFQLQLAFNPQTSVVTGFYENYTGWDEETQAPRFSCILYIEGKLIGNSASIKTYYPINADDDLITGIFKVLSEKEISISLPNEHGGCWNVPHFVDEPVTFTLEEEQKWIAVRHVTADKAFFYSDKNEATKRKGYMVKGDIFYVDKIEGDWLHGIYKGKTTTEGWVKVREMNMLKY